GFNDDSPNAFSATSVRSELMRTGNVQSLSAQVPDFVLKEIQTNYRKTFPLTRNDFSAPLLYKLRSLAFLEEMQKLDETEPPHAFSDYLDVGGSLARRIVACMNQYDNYKQFTELLKTKNITYSAISRALVHILLEIKKDLMNEFIEDNCIGYARMLGFREDAAPLLSEIKKNSSIPLISKLKDAPSYLDDTSMKMLQTDIFAAELYEQIACQKFAHPFRSEYTQEIVKI
ncbi:MAG: nucleotidyltransferase family protein, partial [Lachnospiraceae bacterium]|nr:nucleotidyltransferase family protein [Lachnospiraceae bacterium]